jgi:hypothetical protein
MRLWLYLQHRAGGQACNLLNRIELNRIEHHLDGRHLVEGDESNSLARDAEGDINGSEACRKDEEEDDLRQKGCHGQGFGCRCLPAEVEGVEV